MPNFIIRWAEETILTAIVQAPDKEHAETLIKGGVTPVLTTPVSRHVKNIISCRPCVDLPQLKSKENAASPTAETADGLDPGEGEALESKFRAASQAPLLPLPDLGGIACCGALPGDGHYPDCPEGESND